MVQIYTDAVKEMLKGIIFSEYLLDFTVKKTGIFPEFKGSIIRGTFGAALRKICCISPKLKTCLNCSVNDNCIYAKTFESVNIEKGNDKFLAHSTHMPHPFVIKDETNNKTYFTEGENFRFKLLVIGDEFIAKVPYYIFAFKNAFESGVKVGNKNINMFLNSVMLYQGQKEINEIYDKTTNTIDKKYKEKFMKSDDILNDDIFSDRLTIEFITPVRLKNEQANVEIDFKTFVKSLLRRLSGITAIYFNKDTRINAQEYLKEAEGVNITDRALEVYRLKRISRKQNFKKIDMSGIKGIIKYSGKAINKYLPLIRLGEYFHIGKWTAFGMGQYKIKDY